MRTAKWPVIAGLFVLMFLYFPGCAPKAVVRTTDAVFRQYELPVSDEELKYWEEAVKTGKDSAERSKGAFWAAQYYLNKKDGKNAEKYFTYNEKYYADTEWGFLAVFRLYQIKLSAGDTEGAMLKMKSLLEKRHMFPDFQPGLMNALTTMLAAEKEEGLKKIYHAHYHSVLDEYSLYYLCRADFDAQNFDAFSGHAGAFLSSYPDSVFYRELADKFAASVKHKPVNNKKLAAIIPLSGKAMAIGALMKNGLELALSEYNEGKPEEEKAAIIYIDEELGDKQLEEAVKAAIEQENVLALIGPLYSNKAKQIMTFADMYNIVLFSPTAAQPDLPGKSPYFFRNCPTAKGQSHALAKYIMGKTDIRKIGTLYPANAYGETLNGGFTEKYTNMGGSVLNQVPFDPKLNDFQKELVMLGGINTILLKEKRAQEQLNLSDAMKDTGKRLAASIARQLEILSQTTLNEGKPKAMVALLHFAQDGDNIKRFSLDDEMTKQLSYAVAKEEGMNVVKQAASDQAMADAGVEPSDLDRELALNVAYQLKADVLIWGKIQEAASNTVYANFLPEVTVDSKGNTKVSNSFKDSDYFYFSVTIQAISVYDENVIDTVYLTHRKIKDPRKNPLELEGLFIPAPDRKMILIRDQIKFYDLDIPVFGSSAMSSNYILGFRENAAGIVFPAEIYFDSQDPAMKAFTEKYREKYAAMPDAISAQSYDLMKIMASIMEKKVTSREVFKEMLSAVRGYQGVTGEFSFDMNNDSIKDYYIMKVGANGFEFLDKEKGD